MELPELPDQKKQRYIKAFDLSAYDAGVLTSSRELADYFEIVAAKTGDPKLSANWISGELAARLNREELDISASKVSAEAYAELSDADQRQHLVGQNCQGCF